MTGTFFATCCFLAVASSALAQSSDWPTWRGPKHDGLADSNQDPPIEFGKTKNVLWQANIPGRGHGSVIVVGDRVVLATADEAKEAQIVLCYDRKTGKQRWATMINEGGFPKINKKASHASSTLACDGERFFISFVNHGAAHTIALDLEGKKLWQTKLTDYIVHQGYGSSPAVYKSLVIVSADTKAGGAICGLERRTGDIKWRVERPTKPNYPSPVIHTINGKDQLFMTGCNRVTCLDPMTGVTLWETDGATTECVTSVVTDGKHVFTSGGYPKNHVSAILADGSGELVWENPSRVYVPSMLVSEGHLYAVMDAGVVVCWKAGTGERLWRERLSGTFSASPVLVGDRMYAGDETGTYHILKVSPKGCEVTAKNLLGDQIFATPAICGGQIFARVVEMDENDFRQEKLYCFTKKD